MSTNHGTLHFSVSGEFIMNAARNFYYGEEKPETALKILSCVRGLKVEDAYALLEGDAILTGVASQTEKINLVREPDIKYKDELAKLLKYRKERNVREAEEDEEYRDTLNMVLEDYVRLAEAEDRKKSASINRPVQNMEKRIAARENDIIRHKFEKFAEQYETNEWAYYSKDAKAGLRNILESEISKPYKMRWIEFYAGKNWIDDKQFNDDDEIEVIDFNALPVRKALLDEYTNHIIDRLRNANKKELREWDEIGIDFWGIRELEEARRELHGRLMVEAGFDPMTERISSGANVFKAMIEVYLEQKARAFGVME